jgi:hypothetical protein
MFGLETLNIKEPKDPPLIERFLKNLKKKSAMLISPSDQRKEAAMNLAKKKFMTSNVFEDNLEGKAKEFMKNKRLNK